MRGMLDACFSIVEDETSAYYALLRQRHKTALTLIERLRLGRFAYPSIYFVGRP
jgi:hypothetical protein